MLESPAFLSMFAYVLVAGLTLGLYMYLTRGRRPEDRLRELRNPDSLDDLDLPEGPGVVAQLALAALPRLGEPMMPGDEVARTKLENRLLHAGLYHPRAPAVFVGAKVLLAALAPLAVLVAVLGGWLGGTLALLLGGIGAAIGMILPGLWLDSLKSKRQKTLRRGVPDMLDMVVLCLEGGLSLQGAMQRVSAEMKYVHPLLGKELDILEREAMLGLSTGESLQRLANRCDLEEVRGLAAVLSQSEKYGASISKSLRIHADTLRQQRFQRAEEQAQQASVKILFPTLLCIFPAIFVVILGPAAIQISQTFGGK